MSGPEFAPDCDVPIAYMQRTADYYSALGYGAPYRWAHYCRGAVSAAGKAARRLARRTGHDRRPLSAGQGRPGSGRAVQRRRQILFGLFGRQRSTTICASRMSPTTGCTRRQRTRTAGFRWRNCGAWQRRGRIGELAPRFHGLPTNRSQRATIERDCPELLARCREDVVDAAVLVPNCPVCHQTREPRRPAFGGKRHRDGGHGLRQGHRRILRRPAVSVQRFPARQFGRAAERPRLAGFHPRFGAARAGSSTGAAHDRAVAAALEHGPVVEARLFEHRPAVARRNSAPATGVRSAEGDCQKNPVQSRMIGLQRGRWRGRCRSTAGSIFNLTG